MTLTEKFPTRRPGQREVIERIASTDKRFTLLAAPTGAGKSVIAAAAAEMMGRRTMILTGTKALQKQYLEDFPLTEIIGMANYTCELLRRSTQDWQRTCKRGPCHDGRRGMLKHAFAHAAVEVEKANGDVEITCQLKADGCEYYDARRAASDAPYAITNYAYWARAQRAMHPILGPFGFLVCDEAHDIAEILIGLQTTEWSNRSVEFLADAGCPVNWLEAETLEEAAAGARTAERVLSEEARTQKPLPEIDREPDDDQSNGEFTYAKQVATQRERLRELIRADESGDRAFVWDVGERRLVNTTLSAESAERWIWKGCPRILLMSATITEGAARTLGIRPEELEVIEADSLIPTERRPVRVLQGAPYMNRGVFEKQHGDRRFTQWLMLIDRILEAAAAVKTIVHVSSYRQADLIAHYSDHAERIITHEPKGARNGVRRFLDAPAGAVLVSPAVATGHDFPGDHCRVQVIAKVPFVAKTPVNNALEAQHEGYSAGKAILKMVQQSGRSTRGPEDASVTFIVDGMVRVFEEPPALDWWPAWFVDAMGYLTRNEVDAILASTLGDTR